MSKNHTETTVTVLPSCDFGCGKDAHYDAATRLDSIGRGSWANMCETHFRSETNRRLGLGVGQRLVVRESK